jgi:hypothetical protein
LLNKDDEITFRKKSKNQTKKYKRLNKRCNLTNKANLDVLGFLSRIASMMSDETNFYKILK